MDLKKKLANVKKKIEENPHVTNAFIIVGCLATTAYSLYVTKRVNETRLLVSEAREEVEMSDAVIRNIYDGVKHARETGHSVTFFDGKGEPSFVISAPDED